MYLVRSGRKQKSYNGFVAVKIFKNTGWIVPIGSLNKINIL
jgi:hypothetical protein